MLSYLPYQPRWRLDWLHPLDCPAEFFSFALFFRVIFYVFVWVFSVVLLCIDYDWFLFFSSSYWTDCRCLFVGVCVWIRFPFQICGYQPYQNGFWTKSGLRFLSGIFLKNSGPPNSNNMTQISLMSNPPNNSDKEETRYVLDFYDQHGLEKASPKF